MLYGVLGPVDVLKGHIIRRSQLCLKEFFLSTNQRWRLQKLLPKEPQDMMVGVRFTYSADHFEGWRLGMESLFFWFANSQLGFQNLMIYSNFCSMLLEDSKRQDALVRVRCLVCFFSTFEKDLL